jgi:hypothetical protein
MNIAQEILAGGRQPALHQKSGLTPVIEADERLFVHVEVCTDFGQGSARRDGVALDLSEAACPSY